MDFELKNLTGKANMGRTERMISIVGGAAALVYTLLRLRKVNAPLTAGSGYLLYRGITGRDPVYTALGIDRAHPNGSGGIEVIHAISINRPRAEVYSYWRDFENLPTFMKHLVSVKVVSQMDGREQSHWTARAPLGQTIEWDGEMVEDRPNERIAWRSLPGSQVETRGYVEFQDAPGQDETILRVNLAYWPPAGSLGAAVAKLLGEEPAIQVQEDLRRLKQYLEAGETATIEGQTSGRITEVIQERQNLQENRDDL